MFEHNRRFHAIAAMLMASLGASPAYHAPRFPLAYSRLPDPQRPKKRRAKTIWGGRRSSKTQAGEMARRLRQIRRGQLTLSNGLRFEAPAGD